MILGSDSHTRYGALGTMAVGEGGPELAKQLLGRTPGISPARGGAGVSHGHAPPGRRPPRRGHRPGIKATVFQSGFVKNRVLEFAGPGIAGLPIDYRNGIDVMTTETTCLSSIWETDGVTEGFYLTVHGRGGLRPCSPPTAPITTAWSRIDLSAD
jgi:aconitate hydratase